MKSVLAVLEECGAYVDDAASFPEQFKPGLVKRHQREYNEARANIQRLAEAAGKAQDTNRDDYVLGRPDVSHLPEVERVAFLRGWDAASEAVYRTGLRAALAAFRGDV